MSHAFLSYSLLLREKNKNRPGEARHANGCVIGIAKRAVIQTDGLPPCNEQQDERIRRHRSILLQCELELDTQFTNTAFVLAHILTADRHRSNAAVMYNVDNASSYRKWQGSYNTITLLQTKWLVLLNVCI